MVLADTSEAFIRCARAAFEFVQRLRTTNRLARARRDLWHDILISTMEERAKVKAVERNPHVSICVLDEKWPPTYLQVFGEAMIDRDPDVVFDVAVRGVELMSGSKVPEELHKPSEREFAAKTGSLSGCAPPRLSIHRRDTPTRQKTCAD